MELLDPKKELALKNYKDPLSDTFGNLKGSMIKAGYKEQYADTIHGRVDWIPANLKADVDMIKQAENNLRHYNSLKIDIEDKNGIDLAKLQVDVSKFIVKTLAKQKYSDNEDKTPPAVQINIVNYSDDKAKTAQDAVIVDDMVQ